MTAKPHNAWTVTDKLGSKTDNYGTFGDKIALLFVTFQDTVCP